ncbi:MAG: hypothetical protein JO071_06370 [Deltaproteobacteria bacterium]|nr:hypothetical protein [Deltaproteobacteria bacterium]
MNLAYGDIFNDDLAAGEMRSFTLQFKGPLHSDQAKNIDKRAERHRIRRAFHEQLFKAWQLAPALCNVSKDNFRHVAKRKRILELDDGAQIRLDPNWGFTLLRGKKFIPLVIRARDMSLVCDLDIRMYWREKRFGGLLRRRDSTEGFDLDNRLKGLLDALAIPQENQLPDDVSNDPDLFLCLLEDDNLIARLSIQAEPLGLPPSANEEEGYVELNVTVKVDGDELGEL